MRVSARHEAYLLVAIASYYPPGSVRLSLNLSFTMAIVASLFCSSCCRKIKIKEVPYFSFTVSSSTILRLTSQHQMRSLLVVSVLHHHQLTTFCCFQSNAGVVFTALINNVGSKAAFSLLM